MKVTVIENEKDVFDYTNEGQVVKEGFNVEYEDPSQYYLMFHRNLISQLLKHKNCADLMSLYMFYCYHAKYQKTNQPWCTDTFCIKGLNWGTNRFYKAKKALLNGFIEVVTPRNEKGQLQKSYIKIKHIIKAETANSIQSNQKPRVDSPQSGFRETNALSNKRNALSNKESTHLFDEFWNKYNYKRDKASALLAFLKLTKDGQRSAIEGIDRYQASVSDRKYLKYPVRYIKHKVWEDEFEPVKNKDVMGSLYG